MKTKTKMNEMVKLLVRKQVRHSMIEEAAHCRAVKRNFLNGDSLTDWLAAEEEVDEKLAMVFLSLTSISGDSNGFIEERRLEALQR
jgi:hypothetical protein